MALIIHQECINQETAEQLIGICPFAAIAYDDGKLTIGSGCKMCKMCVRKGPKGAITWEEEALPQIDKSQWKGIAVFAEMSGGKVHPVVLELLGKAQELAHSINHPVYALLVGKNVEAAAEELLHYGADDVYVYQDDALEYFQVSPYAAVFCDFIEKVKPSSIMVGATSLGRTLAPKVAARLHTGLTADCTMLQMRPNSDLVQIRPAFGGNIMAQIITPNHRPQFCTVRYKIFSAPVRSEETAGTVHTMEVTQEMLYSRTEVLGVQEKPKDIDISDAEIVIAVGRGVKSDKDMAMIETLAELLNAQIAGTRPMIEAGRIDPRKQIGLSGRTVNAKLLLAIGISGSVQFVAGMKSSQCIIAINSDPNAAIFDVAHYGFVGDLYQIVPKLIETIQEAHHV